MDRETITCYRVGSHRLKIQTGRQLNQNVDERLCNCSTAIQTLEHVIFKCPLTLDIRLNHGIVDGTLESFFDDQDHMKLSSTFFFQNFSFGHTYLSCGYSYLYKKSIR